MSQSEEAVIEPSQDCEESFVQFWVHVGPWIASGEAEPESVAHEAYCAGWAAAIPVALHDALCWEQPVTGRIIACDRKKNHKGLHSWGLEH